MGFSKAMSAGWLQVDKTAEGGPRVMRKVRPTYFPGKNNSYSGFFELPRETKIGSKNRVVQEIRGKTEGACGKKSLDLISNSPFLYGKVKKQFPWKIMQFIICHLGPFSMHPINYIVRLSKGK